MNRTSGPLRSVGSGQSSGEEEELSVTLVNCYGSRKGMTSTTSLLTEVSAENCFLRVQVWVFLKVLLGLSFHLFNVFYIFFVFCFLLRTQGKKGEFSEVGIVRLFSSWVPRGQPKE